MFKYIFLFVLLLSLGQVKVNAQDKTDYLLGELKAQLGQKRAVIYNQEAVIDSIYLTNYCQ
jgi:hypothetical protein